MNIHQAVRTLRKRAGESQHMFAARCVISIRALQKYEDDQWPSPRSLVRFMALSKDAGFQDLYALFEDALFLSLGLNGWKFAIHLEKFDTPAGEQLVPDIRWPRRKKGTK